MCADYRNKNPASAGFDRDFNLLQELSSFVSQSDCGTLRLWQKFRL
jgi:hypothetical protein